MTANVPTNDPSPAKRFALHQVIDRQHGIVSGVIEHPADWVARSDVRWNMQDVSWPVVGYAQVYNPNGPEVFELLPSESCCWVVPDPGMYPPGTPALGQTYLPPMRADEALVRWVVPRYRANRPGLRIMGAEPAPEVMALLQRIGGGELRSVQPEAARVRLEYGENGRNVEEEIYGLKVSSSVPYYGPMGTMTQINWGFAWLFGFRTTVGALDARRELFWRIAGSIRPNPQWEQLRMRIMQQLKARFDQYIQMGYSQIQAAGQMSRAISANNDAMLASFDQQRQAAAHADAMRRDASTRSPTDGFDEYIRGVETVNDPYWGTSQQDASYQYHWTDGSGNYKHSNDPFFNPNAGGTQSWTLMDPQR